MPSTNTTLIQLKYGIENCFSMSIPDEQLVGYRTGPRPTARLQEKTYQALLSPLEYPPLDKAILPDDHITIVIDTQTPAAADLVAALWQFLEEHGIAAENVTLLQPFRPGEGQPDPDPRSLLPAEIREQICWKVHNPEESNSCAYLTSATTGDQIFLARELVEADFVISIGQIAFDALLGFRGTNSVFYPGLSRTEAIRQSQGQGHLELGPHDQRPLRQLVDEIGWLLGAQFTIQVIPSAEGGVYHILAGEVEAVLRKGKELLTEHWMINLSDRPDTVVLALDSTRPQDNWEALGRALATARRLVKREGRVVILSDISEIPVPPSIFIKEATSPGDALRKLRETQPPDIVATSQILQAAQWASLFWLSKLNSDLVEDLFFVPLANEQEIIRLLKHAENCLFLGAAEHTTGHIEADE